MSASDFPVLLTLTNLKSKLQKSLPQIQIYYEQGFMVSKNLFLFKNIVWSRCQTALMSILHSIIHQNIYILGQVECTQTNRQTDLRELLYVITIQ